MRLRNSGKSTRYVHVRDEHGKWTVQPVRPGRDSRDLTDEEFELPENQKFVTKGLMRARASAPKLKAPALPAPPPVASSSKAKTKKTGG